jgi:alcohol dehydrogenase
VKAVKLKEGHQLALEDAPRPEILDPDDMIVKVTTAAICGSDVHIKYGEIPFIPPDTILGHEFVGLVEEVGPAVTRFSPGDRVVVAAGIWCGFCPACQRRESQNCPNAAVFGGGMFRGRSLQGAQTEYVRVPNADMCTEPVPENVPDEQAILIGDVFSTGYHAAKEAGIDTGDVVAVFGCGPIGLSAVVSAQLFGPRKVYAVDVFENRLSLAKHYGAETINAKETDPVRYLLSKSDMQGIDSTIEASGIPEVFGQAISSIRRGGVVSVVGLFNGSYELPLQMLGLYGLHIHMGLANLGYMKQLLAMLADNKLDLSPFCTHLYPLEEALQAYEFFENEKDKCLKVMLKVDS